MGCSSVNIDSVKNRFEIKYPSTQPPSNSLQDNEAKAEQRSWQIPSPAKKKIIRTSREEMDSEDGKKVEIETVTYASRNAFFFAKEMRSDSREIQSNNELLKLESVVELKVRKRAFCYIVFARQTKPDAQTGRPIPGMHMFVYRIFDKDGDGKFETLLADDSKILVPEWATER